MTQKQNKQIECTCQTFSTGESYWENAAGEVCQIHAPWLKDKAPQSSPLEEKILERWDKLFEKTRIYGLAFPEEVKECRQFISEVIAEVREEERERVKQILDDEYVYRVPIMDSTKEWAKVRNETINNIREDLKVSLSNKT